MNCEWRKNENKEAKELSIKEGMGYPFFKFSLISPHKPKITTFVKDTLQFICMYSKPQFKIKK